MKHFMRFPWNSIRIGTTSKAFLIELQTFKDTLEFYEKDESLSIYDLTVKAPGLTAADLYTTNWQVTLSTNSLRLINFETITLLSKIDAKHKELKDQGDVLTSLVYNTAIYKNDREGFYHRKVLASWIGGYMGNEKELIALYDEFKERIAEESSSFQKKHGIEEDQLNLCETLRRCASVVKIPWKSLYANQMDCTRDPTSR